MVTRPVLRRVAFRWVLSVIAKFFLSVALHTRVGRDAFGFSPGSAQRSRTRCRLVTVLEGVQTMGW